MNRETQAQREIKVSRIKNKTSIAILTIRGDEFEAVESRLGEVVNVIGGGNDYTAAIVETEAKDKVVVALTRCSGDQGNLPASTVTANMITDLNPEWLFLVGIAGGVPDDEFCLGDVIVASRLHDFSFGAAKSGQEREYETAGGPMHRDVERFLSTRIFGRNLEVLQKLAGFETDPKFSDHPAVPDRSITRNRAVYGAPDFRKKVLKTLEDRFPDGKRSSGIRIHEGACANGNLLVKDDSLVKGWQKFARRLTHVETELAGAYAAAHGTGRRSRPLLAIRGLSDIIGLARDDAWTPYACETAGALAVAVIRSGFIKFSKANRIENLLEEKGSPAKAIQNDPPRAGNSGRKKAKPTTAKVESIDTVFRNEDYKYLAKGISEIDRILEEFPIFRAALQANADKKIPPWPSNPVRALVEQLHAAELETCVSQWLRPATEEFLRVQKPIERRRAIEACYSILGWIVVASVRPEVAIRLRAELAESQRLGHGEMTVQSETDVATTAAAQRAVSGSAPSVQAIRESAELRSSRQVDIPKFFEDSNVAQAVKLMLAVLWEKVFHGKPNEPLSEREEKRLAAALAVAARDDKACLYFVVPPDSAGMFFNEAFRKEFWKRLRMPGNPVGLVVIRMTQADGNSGILLASHEYMAEAAIRNYLKFLSDQETARKEP